jgi:hypothetical protein
MNRSRERHVI